MTLIQESTLNVPWYGVLAAMASSQALGMAYYHPDVSQRNNNNVARLWDPTERQRKRNIHPSPLHQ